jgi:hypothetical protein
MSTDHELVKEQATALSPPQAPPVVRTVTGTAAVSDAGVEASDLDHNNEDQHDVFIVRF